MSIGEKGSEDRSILADVLPDFIFLGGLVDQQRVQDKLTKELQKMVCEEEIPVLLVFAIQVYLNIHRDLQEEVGRGFEYLRSGGVRVAKSLRESSQYSPD